MRKLAILTVCGVACGGSQAGADECLSGAALASAAPVVQVHLTAAQADAGRVTISIKSLMGDVAAMDSIRMADGSVLVTVTPMAAAVQSFAGVGETTGQAARTGDTTGATGKLRELAPSDPSASGITGASGALRGLVPSDAAPSPSAS